MADDSLRLCPVEEWSRLEKLFEADWPRSVPGFMIFQTQKYLAMRDLDYGFKAYCPFGDGRNGLVALNIKNTSYELILQCPSDDTRKLEDALKTSKIIDWNREIQIPFVPEHVMDCLQRVMQHKKMSTVEIIPSTTYILDKKSPLFNVQLPLGFRFDLLSLKHVDLLDSTWPHRYQGSEFLLELMIKARLGFGLIRDGKLISWVLLRETGTLLHLYTLQEERRKGYGELVLKLISDVLREDGKPVVAFCKVGNVNADKLYQKLNFTVGIKTAWCTFSGKT